MRRLFIAGLLVAALAGCNNNPGQNAVNEKDTIKKDTTKVTANKVVVTAVTRNWQVTAENAYSDLFMDSATVEQFIARQKLPADIALALRNFYNARNFEYAWFAGDGFTEPALAFRSLYDYNNDSSIARKLLDEKLDELMDEDSLSVALPDPDITKTELLLSWRFINYLNDHFNDAARRELLLENLVPSKKLPVFDAADSLLGRGQDIVLSGNPAYALLKDQLRKYVSLAKKGGWPVLPHTKKKYKRGNSNPVIKAIKKRLEPEGWLPGGDTTAMFDDSLAGAAGRFQLSLGYKADSIISPDLIKEMNTPAKEQVRRIIINMQRMQWAPDEPAGKLITVNIPEFKLYAWNGKAKVFDMPIVVGKQGHGTVMFSGKLDRIVFSPYWNLPESIVRKEVLPAMKKDKKYLEKNEMEITGKRNGLPVVRQLPGDKNELGKVKFLFPNSFNIYFHDTPHKWLFSRQKRAYSHGCIRVAEPAELAAYLLESTPGWTAALIDSAMNSGKEKVVKLNEPAPVLINYYTVWMNREGVLQFRTDIYLHDKKMGNKLFSD